MQILTDHTTIDKFEIGDVPNSATCDYMDNCDYKCLPDTDSDKLKLNYDTYNEAFMMVNSDKIIKKIKDLMKQRFFYTKKDLFNYINVPKKYPTAQIYTALTELINDSTEYILDKYNRTGYLVNIGDYYLFQPSELNSSNISVYDRSVPLDYKHNMIKFDVKNDLIKPVIDKTGFKEKENELDIELDKEETDDEKIEMSKGKDIINEMRENYNKALTTTKVSRGENDWFKYCGVVLRKMHDEDKIDISILEEFLIEHIVDSLIYTDRIELFNYLIDTWNNDCNSKEYDDRFIIKVKRILCSKIIKAKNIIGTVIFNGSSRKDNLNIYVLKDKKWVPAELEDKKDLMGTIANKYKLKSNLNKYVGFIGFETNHKYMVYKLKDTSNERSTGSRCDQAGKDKTLKLLNEIEGYEKYKKGETKTGLFELCVLQEFTLRNFERIKKDGKTWFLDTETAIVNEFEKREKN